MTTEEYQWQVNLVKDRYHALNLTYEQSEKVYKYEHDKETFSEKHIFSAWEEWDYELTVFKNILNEEQFARYQLIHKENIQNYEQILTQQDNEADNQTQYYEELLNFYENQFLPDFFNTAIFRFGFILSEKTKMEYLKKEYKRFLNDTKKEMLTNHFRYNRTFKPNELNVALLRHKLFYFLPNYQYFKYNMDEPTKAVAKFLYAKVQNLPEEIEELITDKFNRVKDFTQKLNQKYYTETAGWHVVVAQQSVEDEKENKIMTCLLLDEQKYGLDFQGW